MATTPKNLAALLDETGKPFRVAESPIDPPGADEVLIKVHAVAINPVDHYRQSFGYYIDTFPWIVGCDGAGIVEEVGQGVQHVKKGDRVTAIGNEFYCHKSTHAMFQQYVTVGASGICKIPDSVEFTDASVLPLGIATAAGMLFETVTLNLRWPEVSKQINDGQEVLIVWGGSSSVGACAIQLAKASGYRAIGIASARNFDMMTRCGTDANFDYSSPELVTDLCRFVADKGWRMAGIAAAISTDDVLQVCGQIASRLPGNKFVSTSLPRGVRPEPPMPEGVKSSNCFGLTEPEIRDHIWKKWMSEALSNGQLKCLPPAEVIGEGIEQVDHGCEVLRQGVSGKKIVVKMC